MSDVYIIGVGMTPFGKHPDQSVKSLTKQAVISALDDAACTVADVGALYFSGTTQGHFEGQVYTPGQFALRPIGFEGIPIFNVENACASGSSALHLASQFIRAGDGEVAMAVGAEKMYSQDKAKMFSVFDAGLDQNDVEGHWALYEDMLSSVAIPSGSQSEAPYSMMMNCYAGWGRMHMKLFGSTREQLAAISAKNHGHSVHNPLSQYRTPFSAEDVLNAPAITYPLTQLMCAPVSDGAAAVIVCSEGALKRFANCDRAVRIRASVVQAGIDRQPEEPSSHLVALAAKNAYGRAGLGPDDMDVAEVHDATAVGEMIVTEDLGFCSHGEGGVLAERGETSIGGRIPVNPSGGLESKGHPIGATGLGQIHEIVTQLRGEAGARQVEGARIGIAENGGGVYRIEESVCAITILGN